MSDNSDWRERLAQFVAARRRELRLDQTELRDRGGPSHATVGLIERGHAPDMQRGTKAGLERSLDWEPGSIDSILKGGDPRPIAQASARGSYQFHGSAGGANVLGPAAAVTVTAPPGDVLADQWPPGLDRDDEGAIAAVATNYRYEYMKAEVAMNYAQREAVQAQANWERLTRILEMLDRRLSELRGSDQGGTTK